MNWGLNYIRRIEKEENLTQNSIDILDSFLSLMRAILPRVQLRLKDPNRLLVQFSGMIVALLKLIDKSKFYKFLAAYNFRLFII